MDKTLIELLIQQSELIGELKNITIMQGIRGASQEEKDSVRMSKEGLLSARQLTLKKLGVLHEESTISTSDSSTDSKHREHSKENDTTS